MAQALSKPAIKALQKLDYKNVRPLLKTGDLVFCSGNYFFSKVIQGLTKSTWSHVGVIYKDEQLDRVMILESETLIGVRLMPLSKYITDYKGTHKAYKGNMLIGHITNTPNSEQLKQAISYGLDQLSRPYDNWEIVRIMLRILFKIGKRERNKNFICSELVRDMFVKAKIDFPMEDTYISPDAIFRNDKVAHKYRLL
jgi:Permuted papain-like amidase enzyme, YaeF/YiiX, C92 family